MQVPTEQVKELDIGSMDPKQRVWIGFDYTGRTICYQLGSPISEGRALHLSPTDKTLIVIHSRILKVGDEVLLTLEEGKKQKAKITDLRIAA